MSKLLDLTNELDGITTATLCAIDEATTICSVPYIVVGATARDMVLHHGYGAPIQRATKDIDFAVQVDSWESFDALKDQLLSANFTETKTPHRLISSANMPVDIVPFGGVEQGNAEIVWPPNGNKIMNVMGFREAKDNAQQILISNNPNVICPVVTPEGLILLKLISWADRARDLRTKDANDIQYILTTYYSIKNIKEDIYSPENIAKTERYDWEPERAACSLLGKVCREIATDRTRIEILKLNDPNNDENIWRIVEEMKSGTTEFNLQLLKAFMEAFTIEKDQT